MENNRKKTLMMIVMKKRKVRVIKKQLEKLQELRKLMKR